MYRSCRQRRSAREPRRHALRAQRLQCTLLASDACTAYTQCMQYTIRRIRRPSTMPSASARAPRQELERGRRDVLAVGAGVKGVPRKRRDLSDIAGTWNQTRPSTRCSRISAASTRIFGGESGGRHQSLRGPLQGCYGNGRGPGNRRRRCLAVRRARRASCRISSRSPSSGKRTCIARLVAERQRRGRLCGRPNDASLASVYRQLRKQGTPIPTNDMWLAALVLQHNLALHARDRHFDHLAQLVRV